MFVQWGVGGSFTVEEEEIEGCERERECVCERTKNNKKVEWRKR
jgi:hypothetical protein